MPSKCRKGKRVGERLVVGRGETPEVAQADLERKLASIQTSPEFDYGTFAEFVWNTYWPHVLPDLRPTSRRKYNGLLRFHILPVLGELPIAEVGLSDLQRLRGSSSRHPKERPRDAHGPQDPDGRPLSPTTVREIVLRAKEVLRLAYKTGATKRQDWDLVKVPQRPQKIDLQPEDDFTPRILKAAEGTYMLGPIWAALFLGLRRGEVCGLRWSAVDRKRLSVAVTEQLQPKDGLVAPKGGKLRTIPITKDLLEYLDRFGDSSSMFVFTDKGEPLKPNEVSKRVPRLCRKCGLKPLRFHDLRHLCVTNLVALNVPLPVVMQIVGHSNLSTTMRYTHTGEDSARGALAAHLESLTKEAK